MGWTTPKSVAISAIAVTAVLFVAREFGLTDNWVTAVSGLATAAVSIFALLLPAQQEAQKRRREHLKVLVDEIFTPLSDDLQQRHLATVARKTFPLDWWPTTGLLIKSRGSLANALSPSPEPRRGLQKNRYEDAGAHYPDLIQLTEEFKRDYEAFLDGLLEQARVLERKLRALPGVRAIDGTEEQTGCYYGALALYVFDRLWVKGYDFPLTTRKVAGTYDRIWTLQKTSDTADVARGTLEEMRQLNEQVEKFIAATDRGALVQEAERMEQRLDHIQDEIAKVQASESLAGKCPATT